MSEPVTAETITDDQIEEMIARSREGRQNAHKRALRADGAAALRGDRCAREAMAGRLNKAGEVTVTLPSDLVDAIRHYLETDWHDGRDPSKLGALNAVAYIGERTAAICAAVWAHARHASQLKP